MPSPLMNIWDATIKEKARAACRRARSVVDAFDDAHVVLRRIAQDIECGLVAGAVVSGDRLGEAVELDQYGALIYAGFISLGGVAAGEEAPTAGEDGRTASLVYFASRTAPALPSSFSRRATICARPICSRMSGVTAMAARFA